MANLSNINNKFLVTTGGNVGIGTTSPSQNLQVVGSIYASGVGSTLLFDTTGALGSNGIKTINDYETLIYNGRGSAGFAVIGNSNIRLGFGTNYTNAETDLYINTSGKVGIGVTSLDSMLTIQGNETGGQTVTHLHLNSGNNNSYPFLASLNSNVIASGTYGWTFNNSSSTGNLEIGRRNNSTTSSVSLCIERSTGNVGIGTTAPDWQLEVEDATTVRAAVTSTNNGTAGVYFRVFLDGNQVGNGTIATQNNGDMKFFNGTSSESEKMRIRASGTVGIGTAGFDSQMLAIAAGTLDGAIYATSTDANCFASFRDGNSSANIEYGAVGNDHVLRKDGTQYFIVNNVGDVYNYQSVNKANTFYGYAAGDYSAAGGSNTFMGYNCANNLSSGAGNVGIGRDVYITTLTGSNNTAVGMSAMQQLTSGGNNVAVGKGAGQNLTSGSVNTFVGDSAGNLATTASSTTAVGFTALSTLSTGVDNTAIGRAAAAVLSTGGYVTAVGNYAADALSTNGVCTAIGWNTLTSNTAGDNVAVGHSAGEDLTSGTLNTYIGNYAGRNATTSSYGIIIGRTAGQQLTSGAEPFYIGYDAGQAVTTGDHNTAIGTSSMTYGNGSSNTYVGWQAGFGTNGQNCSHNTSVGKQSLRNVSTGSYNVAMGYYSGYSLTTANYNTLIGNIAGNTLTAGGNNTGVGHEAFRFLTTGTTNTAVGLSAMEASTTAYENTALGYRALRNCTTGAGNIGIGIGAGINVSSGGSNIAIGYSAMGSSTVTGGGNIAFGDASGYELTSGANNVLIGKNSGRNTSGTDSLAQVTTQSNQIQIGNKTHTDAKVNISWTIVSDKRDKTNIKELDKGLDFVENLKPVSFERRKNRETQETDNKERYGFLAQDVLELEGENPVIVNNEDKDNLKLTSDYIIPILVNSIKELKAEIELLKSK